MLISKNSRKNKDAFKSRFVTGSADFPLRQYLSCREEMGGKVVHLFLLAAFCVALVYFSLTLHRVFSAHGQDLNPWYERFAIFGVFGMFLLALRRIFNGLRALRELRAEMSEYRSRLPNR